MEVLIPFSSGLGCSRKSRLISRFQQVLIPFSSGLGCSEAATVASKIFRVLIPFSSGLGCSLSPPKYRGLRARLNPFFFRARLQPKTVVLFVLFICLNPFFFRARLQPQAYAIPHQCIVLIPFSSGLGCSDEVELDYCPHWS